MADNWTRCKNCGRTFKEDDPWSMGYCSDRCKREYYANNPEAEENDEWVRKWTLRLRWPVMIIILIGVLIYYLGGCE